MKNRDYYLDQLKAVKDNGFVKIILGVRRCGKSTLLSLFQIFLMESESVDTNHIITLNFESFLFDEYKDAKKLHEYVGNKIKDKGHYYLFIDEIQEVDLWAKAINSLRVTYSIDIYVTGSNSKVFSGEYLTYLSGRYISINMYPLSFDEFTTFQDLSNDNEVEYTNFLKSSFPAIVLEKNENIAQQINIDLFQSIFERDIMLRGKIRNESAFVKVARFVYENIGNILSVKSICDNLKSIGHKIDVEAIDNYLTLMCKAYCLYQCQRYDIRGKEILKTNGKYYTIDFGLRSGLVPNEDVNTGKIFENFIYLELIKKGYSVYVGKVGREYEVDFVAIKNDTKIYVQVSESILDENTRFREIRPFELINDKYQKYLVTKQKEIFLFDSCIHIHWIDFIKII